MKVGDLVKLNPYPTSGTPKLVGLITDAVEDESGFFHYEVVAKNDCGWYSGYELEVIDESR